MRKYVNVYQVGRAYGGPEEGGWYFDHGVPVASIPVEFDDDSWAKVQSAAVENGILEYKPEDDMFRPTYSHAGPGHEHIAGFCDADGWKCADARWVQFYTVALLDMCQKVAEEWEEKYGRTGKRSSVLGGDDYDVLIQDEFAAEWDTYEPYS